MEKDQLVAAGFIYLSNSSISWLEFVVTNPEASPESRHMALEALLPALFKLAKDNGAASVFTSLTDEGLIKRYVRHGFGITDTGVTHLLRGL